MLNQPAVESDLNELAIFVKVADAGTFTAAARALGLPKSTVSRKIASLEERLETRLIQRTTRKIALTDAGQRFYERCRRIIEAIGDAERELGDHGASPRGRIRITAPVDFGQVALAKPICAFGRRFPEVRLEVEVSQRVVDLVGENFDLAVRIGPLRDSTMIARRLTTVESLFVGSPAYVQTHGVPAHPRDLDGHRLLVFAPTPASFEWRLAGPAGPVSLTPDGVIVSNHFAIVRDAVLSGQGLALLPSFAVHEQLADGSLVQLLGDWKTERAEVHAVYPSSRHLSPTVRAFLDLLVETLAE